MVLSGSRPSSQIAKTSPRGDTPTDEKAFVDGSGLSVTRIGTSHT